MQSMWETLIQDSECCSLSLQNKASILCTLNVSVITTRFPRQFKRLCSEANTSLKEFSDLVRELKSQPKAFVGFRMVGFPFDTLDLSSHKVIRSILKAKAGKLVRCSFVILSICPPETHKCIQAFRPVCGCGKPMKFRRIALVDNLKTLDDLSFSGKKPEICSCGTEMEPQPELDEFSR